MNRLLHAAIRALRTEGPAQDVVNATATLMIGLLLIALDLVGVWTMIRIWPVDGSMRWIHAIPLLAGAAAMLIKRKRPMLALAVGLTCFAADLSIGGSLGMIFVLFDLLYAAGMHTRPAVQRALLAVVLTATAALSVAAGVAAEDPRSAVWIALQFGAIFILPLWWAANVRQKAELAAMAAERAELEQARAKQIEQIAAMAQHEAIQAERSAMARDLHDVIASHLSATTIHSAAALAAPPDPSRDRAALESVRSSSLAALAEMRSMIMLLRDEQRPGHPDPIAAAGGLDRLDELVQQVRDHGRRVDLAYDPVDGLPTAVGQAAYRIVQEALTNAVKHAGPGALRVQIRVLDGWLAVRVESPLRVDGEDQPGDQPGDRLGDQLGDQQRDPDRALGSGTGMWSMRERAEALGGRLTAGPVHDHWVVEGRIPVAASVENAKAV